MIRLVFCSAPALSLALSLLLASPARAQDVETERARSHLKAGVAYYDEARYEDAAREMEAAYRFRPLPDLQYNLAQCYERLGRARDAVAAYKTYLAGKPGSDDQAEILKRVENLEARATKEGDGGPPPLARPGPTEKVVLKEVVVYREAPPKPGRGARYVAIALGVVAAGALASGIALAVLASRNADQVTSGGNPVEPVPFSAMASQAQAAGQQQQVLSWVSFGVAGAAAVGAVGLYLLGNRIDKEAAALSFSPLIGPGGAGVAVAGSF